MDNLQKSMTLIIREAGQPEETEIVQEININKLYNICDLYIMDRRQKFLFKKQPPLFRHNKRIA